MEVRDFVLSVAGGDADEFPNEETVASGTPEGLRRTSSCNIRRPVREDFRRVTTVPPDVRRHRTSLPAAVETVSGSSKRARRVSLKRRYSSDPSCAMDATASEATGSLSSDELIADAASNDRRVETFGVDAVIVTDDDSQSRPTDATSTRADAAGRCVVVHFHDPITGRTSPDVDRASGSGRQRHRRQGAVDFPPTTSRPIDKTVNRSPGLVDAGRSTAAVAAATATGDFVNGCLTDNELNNGRSLPTAAATGNGIEHRTTGDCCSSNADRLASGDRAWAMAEASAVKGRRITGSDGHALSNDLMVVDVSRYDIGGETRVGPFPSENAEGGQTKLLGVGGAGKMAKHGELRDTRVYGFDINPEELSSNVRIFT